MLMKSYLANMIYQSSWVVLEKVFRIDLLFCMGSYCLIVKIFRCLRILEQKSLGSISIKIMVYNYKLSDPYLSLNFRLSLWCLWSPDYLYDVSDLQIILSSFPCISINSLNEYIRHSINIVAIHYLQLIKVIVRIQRSATTHLFIPYNLHNMKTL